MISDVNYLERSEWLLVCNCSSVMEIYHDSVFDLLSAFQDLPGVPHTRTMLKVRDHPKRGVHIQGHTDSLIHEKISK